MSGNAPLLSVPVIMVPVLVMFFVLTHTEYAPPLKQTRTDLQYDETADLFAATTALPDALVQNPTETMESCPLKYSMVDGVYTWTYGFDRPAQSMSCVQGWFLVLEAA